MSDPNTDTPQEPVSELGHRIAVAMLWHEAAADLPAETIRQLIHAAVTAAETTTGSPNAQKVSDRQTTEQRAAVIAQVDKDVEIYGNGFLYVDDDGMRRLSPDKVIVKQRGTPAALRVVAVTPHPQAVENSEDNS